ncbi:hypothetical protein P7D22_01935 [Lichenihabitans sp. Uapishka_5]|uniref:hypothetical protein n=1 Tax=Lichenihabitans sp. Uapishka_5 TaxID=3037302 RepID=UPI0029E81833|nr:hypothetical protein [Lichenihabitans sp. Uapishka_5]MDX7949935.1 hypothetical protein [Lichenihabitans sp. Uapishka_5]
MRRGSAILAFAALASLGAAPSRAETVMQQCGQQYQSAKAAGSLNGMSWNQFRSDCATRLKGQPAAAAAPAAAPAATPVSNPLNPTPAAIPSPATVPAPATTAAAPAATVATPAPSGGRAAFLVREKQCGAEWRANKVNLTASTPGLTWPKYLSQCNARLKQAGK